MLGIVLLRAYVKKYQLTNHTKKEGKKQRLKKYYFDKMLLFLNIISKLYLSSIFTLTKYHSLSMSGRV